MLSQLLGGFHGYRSYERLRAHPYERLRAHRERTHRAQRRTTRLDRFNRFDRLFKSKGDAAVVALEHEVCTGCHMKVTIATVMRVKAGKEIVSCEQCGRILYDAA